MNVKVIGIGDNIVDKYKDTNLMFPGGHAANFSVYAKYVGAESAYFGAFGNDAAAEHFIRVLTEIGVDLSRCRRYEDENRCVTVEIVGGDRKFFCTYEKYANSPDLNLKFTEDDLKYISSFDLIYTSSISFIDSELPVLGETGVPIAYDFSDTYDEEDLKQICPLIQFAFLSCPVEGDNEIEKIMKFAYESGCPNIIVTRGEKGSVYYDGLRFYRAGIVTVTPVDTLGAGDAFAAGCLCYIMDYAKKRGWDDLKTRRFLPAGLTSESLHVGARAAVKACKTSGAFGHSAPLSGNP